MYHFHNSGQSLTFRGGAVGSRVERGAQIGGKGLIAFRGRVRRVGISGQAQIWFSSYLQNRHQSVKIEDTFSDKVTLSYGVPHGSVLGPVFFTLYTTPLSAIIVLTKPPPL